MHIITKGKIYYLRLLRKLDRKGEINKLKKNIHTFC